jgi:SNF2 family DNA or RNA helicase
LSISRNYIKGLATNSATYFRGVNYATPSRVKNIIIDDADENGIVKLFARVRGTGSSYNVNISSDTLLNEITEYSCTCPAFMEYDGACKHIIATIMLTESDVFNNIDSQARIFPVPEKINNAIQLPDFEGRLLEIIKRETQKKNGNIIEPINIEPQKTETRTDVIGLNLIRTYTNNSTKQLLSASIQNKVSLVPTMEIDYKNHIVLSFKIGAERLYVLRDLVKFQQDMLSGNTVQYGKSLTFLHELGGFDEQSKAIIQYFMTYYSVNGLAYAGISGYYYGTESKKYMYLTPFMLDKLMEIMSGKTISILKLQNPIITASIELRNPQLEINVTRNDEDSFCLSLSDYNLTLMSGASKIYILQHNTIFSSDEDYSRNVKDILNAFLQKSSSININSKDMTALCSNVLNHVSAFIKINAEEELSDFQPLPLVARLYLDMPAQDFVTAQLMFEYGENKYNAYDKVSLTKACDLQGELLAKTVVAKYFDSIDLAQKCAFIRDDEQKLYRLVSEGVSELTNYCEIYATDNFKALHIKHPPAVSVGVRLESDLLNLSFDIGDMNIQDLLNILHSYKHAKKYHRLTDGSFFNLENTSLSELSQLTLGLDLSDKDIAKGEINIPKFRALYIDNMITQSELLKYDRNNGFKKIIRDIKDVSDSDYIVPESLKHILRQYQDTGFRWLKTMSAYGFGGILADDMGLGKTLQVIALFLSLKDEKPQCRTSLVVCPSSLVLNWESELDKFAPTITKISVIGTSAERADILNNSDDFDVLITSYDLLKRDIEIYQTKNFYYQIIDEAQYIKNHNTQNAKSVKQIKSVQRFALTGTPIENSLAELWSIYDYLMPGYLYSYNKFKQRFEMPIVRSKDEKALDGLKKLVAPFILRRLKHDVLKELPDKTETIMHCKFEGEQLKLYLANVAKIKKELSDQIKQAGFDNSKIIILSMLTRLRQLCCDPSLMYANYTGGSAKLEMCLELIVSCIESGHKLLLFSQFTSMLNIIQGRLRTLNVKSFMLQGSTSKEERKRLVDLFNVDDTPVFLISLKAGGTGLNLTGADIVIHYDPWWNVSAQNQATDRVHRIGQKNSVQVYKLIAKDTIEEKILKLQQNKADLADLIVREGDGIIARMSKEEITSLFD